MRNTSADDRNLAAQMIARWLEGRISNQEFDDQWPWKSEDSGVVDIGSELWTLFDDFPETVLNTSTLRSEDVDLLRRCLSFLESEEHYEPVGREQHREGTGLISKLFGFRQKYPESMSLKIPESRRKWWPFLDESQCRKCSGQ